MIIEEENQMSERPLVQTTPSIPTTPKVKTMCAMCNTGPMHEAQSKAHLEGRLHKENLKKLQKATAVVSTAVSHQKPRKSPIATSNVSTASSPVSTSSPKKQQTKSDISTAPPLPLPSSEKESKQPIATTVCTICNTGPMHESQALTHAHGRQHREKLQALANTSNTNSLPSSAIAPSTNLQLPTSVAAKPHPANHVPAQDARHEGKRQANPKFPPAAPPAGAPRDFPRTQDATGNPVPSRAKPQKTKPTAPKNPPAVAPSSSLSSVVPPSHTPAPPSLVMCTLCETGPMPEPQARAHLLGKQHARKLALSTQAA